MNELKLKLEEIFKNDNMKYLNVDAFIDELNSELDDTIFTLDEAKGYEIHTNQININLTEEYRITIHLILDEVKYIKECDIYVSYLTINSINTPENYYDNLNIKYVY